MTESHENETNTGTEDSETVQDINLDEGKFNIMDIATLLEAIEIAYKREVYSGIEVNTIQPSFDKAKNFLMQFSDKGEETTPQEEPQTEDNTE